MEFHVVDLPPMFYMKFRIIVRKLSSVLCVVSKIWFGVDSNAHATSKKITPT